MTIEQYKDLPIIDENERVLIVTSDPDHIQLYKGLLVNVPTELLTRELWTVSALGDAWTSKYRLDRYGWTGLFVEEEDFEVSEDDIATL